MKPSLSSCSAGALLLLIAYLIGYSTGSRPEAPVPRGAQSEARPAAGNANEPAAPSIGIAAGTSHSPAVLSGEQAKVEIFETLAVPNRIERLRRLCELAGSVTAENWREMLEAFDRQTLSSGRFNREELRIVLERVGEVAGSAAIEEAFGSSKPQDRSRVSLLLTGWASVDPKSAQGWLEAQPPETRTSLAGPLINGMARIDPQLAVTFLATDAPEMRDMLVPQMTDEIIQRGGLRESDDLLAAIRARDDIPYEIKGSVFGGAAMRRIELARMRGEPAEVLDWSDRYIGGTALMGPKATTAMVRSAAQADAPGTFEWIEAREGRWTQEQEASIFPAIAEAMQKQAPEQFAAWMEAHPDHPQRDGMMAAIAMQFARGGDRQQARRWSETIQDADARATVEKALDAPQAPRWGSDR